MQGFVHDDLSIPFMCVKALSHTWTPAALLLCLLNLPAGLLQ